jgi:hypothetical protein
MTCKYNAGDVCKLHGWWCPYIYSWKHGTGKYPTKDSCLSYKEGLYSGIVEDEIREYYRSEVGKDLYSESMAKLAKDNGLSSSSFLFQAMPNDGTYISNDEMIRKAKEIETKYFYEKHRKKGFWESLFS